MSGADIIPPILPAPAHEDMFLEWRDPDSEAGFRQLCRLRAHVVEQCVLSYAPRAWERLSKMDEANRARALSVSIDNACRGIDREIARYLANHSHPAQLFRPEPAEASHLMDASPYFRAMSRVQTVAEATAERLAEYNPEPPVRAWCECYRRDAVSDECSNCDQQFRGQE